MMNPEADRAILRDLLEKDAPELFQKFTRFYDEYEPNLEQIFCFATQEFHLLDCELFYARRWSRLYAEVAVQKIEVARAAALNFKRRIRDQLKLYTSERAQ
jgi:hypothetical protein